MAENSSRRSSQDLDIETGSINSSSDTIDSEKVIPMAQDGIVDDGSNKNGTLDTDHGQKNDHQLETPGVSPPSPRILDWDSPTDPDNPRTWSTSQKVFQTIAPATFGFMM